MPDIFANIEHLADLPLYKVEKPYGALLSNGSVYFSQGHRLDNIEFTEHRRKVVDVGNNPAYTLPKNGFQIFKQESETMWDVSTIDLARRHREEIAEWLKGRLDAVFVHTYDLRTRLNDETPRDQVDVLSPLVVEPRARGAHNDVTLKSGPDIFFNHLIEGQEDYLKPGYRVRIMK
ncbi:hypothetical protein FQN49_000922 [Arthroderma sp. PD_2]|nr:hypothetical protein FQN49_000922 [Arthroderma sp. PD_2]